MVILLKQPKKENLYGCDNYPKCDYALWDKPTGENVLNNLLVENKNVINVQQILRDSILSFFM